MTILSILIPTIPERCEMFTVLFNELNNQLQYIETTHPDLGQVEILVDDSKRFIDGGLSIGKKREALVKRAEGKYLCFLDDDDFIAKNYLETLLRLCRQDADVCTFSNLTKMENYWMIVDMSLKYLVNDQATPEYIIRRRPWHICPVRSLFAKLHNFSDINYGEDWAWFEQVLTHCTTEAKSGAVLHEYRHGKHSESDKILREKYSSLIEFYAQSK